MEGTDIRWDNEKNTLYVTFAGRIDSLTTQGLDRKISFALEGHVNPSCVVDAEKLGYISSAGIRILIGLAGQCRDMKIVGVSMDVYDIFSMTGLTNLVSVERRIRKIRQPVPGMLLSREKEADIYRDTEDLVIKIFHPEISLEEVQRRWKLSNVATSHGIPSPIAFEVVSCNGSYGIIYEKMHGRTLDELWRERPDDMEDEIRLFSELMTRMHHCQIREQELPDIAERTLREIERTKILAEDEKRFMKHLIGSLGRKDIFVCGNLRLNNVLLQDGRLMILDLTRAGRGNPVLDLQFTASAMCEDGHAAFWKRLFARYAGKLAPERRYILESALDPGIRPWWK
ncbi:MAG: phosphotransferase [Lachnospiraceae bacterium]|nr:phosphotransferase [Lachnospiraceae bacterium]